MGEEIPDHLKRSLDRGACLLVIVALGLAQGCTTTREVWVTPYFRMRATKPTIDIPHAFESGPRSAEAQFLTKRGWEVINETLALTAWPLAGGAAVAFDDGGFRGVVVIASDGRRWNIACAGFRAQVEPSGQSLTCLEHVNRVKDLPDGEIRLRVFAWTGEVLKTYSPQPIPTCSAGATASVYPGPIGFLENGAPVVLVECLRPDFADRRQCMLFSPKVGSTDDRLEVVAQTVATRCWEPTTWNGSVLPDRTIRRLEPMSASAQHD